MMPSIDKNTVISDVIWGRENPEVCSVLCDVYDKLDLSSLPPAEQFSILRFFYTVLSKFSGNVQKFASLLLDGVSVCGMKEIVKLSKDYSWTAPELQSMSIILYRLKNDVDAFMKGCIGSVDINSVTREVEKIRESIEHAEYVYTDKDSVLKDFNLLNVRVESLIERYSACIVFD